MDFDIDELKTLKSTLETEIHAMDKYTPGNSSYHKRLLSRIENEIESREEDEIDGMREAAYSPKEDQ